jgi:hypothetical protein
MREAGSRVFGFRPILGQDAQQIGIALTLLALPLNRQ